MSQKSGPVVLHEAFEEGAARAWTGDESRAWVWTAAILGMMWGVPLGILVGGGLALWQDFSFPWSLGIGAAGGYLAVSAAVLVWGMYPQFGRLWSEREARTYAPPQPQSAQLPSPWRPPVPVHRREGTTLLDMNERPALPDGRQSGLALTPPTVAAILREVITRHDGLWSRDRLMAIRVEGARVTRTLYEELTSKLAQSGFLQERTSGGFKLPDDLVSCDDLVRYFPSLAEPDGGKDGGTAGTGGPEGGKVPGRGVGTLAARRKRLWEECGHDVEAYLARKRGDDV